MRVWTAALGAILALGFTACGERASSARSHQTDTTVHEEGTGGSGAAGCSHDPESANPCDDSFFIGPESVGR
jgi:hypothetical protein